VAAFLAETPFEAKLSVPGNREKEIQAFVASEAAQTALGTATVSMEAGTVTLKCIYAEAFGRARDAILQFKATLSTHMARECCVCFEPVPKQLQTCGHSTMCETCTAQNIHALCGENQFPVPCDEPGCQTQLLSEDLATLADNVDALKAVTCRFATWRKDLPRRRARRCLWSTGKSGLAKGLAHFVLRSWETLGYCSTPNCKQILDRTQPSATCGVCQRRQCPLCGKTPQAGETCAEAVARISFLSSPEDAASTIARKLTTSFLCPVCSTCCVEFIDFSGCFALSCVSCSTAASAATASSFAAATPMHTPSAAPGTPTG
jgi:hypothetical protein